MPNFLLAYHGGDAESEGDMQAVMQAWMTWMGGVGEAMVDAGNPVSQTRTIAPDGSVTEGSTNAITGYSVVAAPDIDAAVAMAKSCPHLQAGGTIEVCETFNVG